MKLLILCVYLSFLKEAHIGAKAWILVMSMWEFLENGDIQITMAYKEHPWVWQVDVSIAYPLKS